MDKNYDYGFDQKIETRKQKIYMSDFLPDSYELPQSGGNYMKLQDGENKIRILSKPIVGWLDWKDKTPYRFQMKSKPDKPMGDKPIRHFWAFIVWSYNNQAIQILEITQQTIQSAITNLSRDSEWGSPFAYDLKINKKGKSLDTEYSVTPSPKKPLPDDIQKAALDKPCNLEALFHDSDPWTVTDKQTELELNSLPF
jgi:hypothetical protein